MKLLLRISANATADSLRRVAPRLSQIRNDFDQYKPSGPDYEAIEISISTAFSGDSARASAKDGIIKVSCGLDFYGDLSPAGDDEFFRFILGKIQDSITASPLAVQDRESYLSFVRRCEA